MFPAQQDAVNASTYDGAHLYVTLDEADQDKILELVRADGSGTYVRKNGLWEWVDPGVDNARVWDRVIIDMNANAIEAYDKLEVAGDERPLQPFLEFELKDGDVL